MREVFEKIIILLIILGIILSFLFINRLSLLSHYYNALGNQNYNSGSFDEAIFYHNLSKDIGISDINMSNLGNDFLQKAIIQEDENIKNNLLLNSLSSYSGSLEIQKDEEVKKNYEFVKSLLDNTQQDSENQDKDEANEQQNQENEKKGGGKQGEDATEESDSSDDSSDDSNMNDKSEANQGDNDTQGTNNQEDQENYQEISKEEQYQIKNYLERIKKEEASNQNYYNKQKPESSIGIFGSNPLFDNVFDRGEKDW